MSRVYEVMFIVRPDVAEEDADKLIAGFSATVTGGGGVVKSVEKMGRRKLAYMVRKFNDGNYVLLTIEANGAVVLELERRLRVTEPVIKFITVRIDEEEKRLAKVKALRGTSPQGERGIQCRRRSRARRRSCRGGSCRAGSGRRLAGFVTNRRCRPILMLGDRLRPIQRSAAPNGRPPEPQESEEETPCLKRLKQRRPKRAQQHPRPAGSGPGPDSGPSSGSGPGPRSGGRPRRTWRPALRRTRRTRQVLPPQEGLQVLHREDRRDPLPRRTAAAGVCGRARQDRAPAAHRRLHHAPAPPDPRHQAGPEHRPAAVCHAALNRLFRSRHGTAPVVDVQQQSRLAAVLRGTGFTGCGTTLSCIRE